MARLYPPPSIRAVVCAIDALSRVFISKVANDHRFTELRFVLASLAPVGIACCCAAVIQKRVQSDSFHWSADRGDARPLRRCAPAGERSSRQIGWDGNNSCHFGREWTV